MNNIIKDIYIISHILGKSRKNELTTEKRMNEKGCYFRVEP